MEIVEVPGLAPTLAVRVGDVVFIAPMPLERRALLLAALLGVRYSAQFS